MTLLAASAWPLVCRCSTKLVICLIFKAGIKFSKLLIYELSAIVSYDGVRHAIAAYNIYPDELLDLLNYDSG